VPELDETTRKSPANIACANDSDLHLASAGERLRSSSTSTRLLSE
jgi:hypothetical protein